MERNPSIVSIQLNRADNKPLYIQIYNGIQSLIEKGHLKAGEKIPPIRELARTLQVNNSTITRALELLAQEGWVQKHVGRGTFVHFPSAQEEKSGILPYDMASLSPSPHLFPVQDFKIALNTALDQEGGQAFAYESGLGYEPLRQTLKDLLQEEGVTVSPHQIQVISGGQQGIDITARVLLGYRDTVFLEDPTYPGSLATFKACGARVMSIPLGEGGLDFVALEQRLQDFRPRLFYAMTTFQNPTGFTYNREQKQRLLELAAKHNFYILEDDYLRPLDYRPYLDERGQDTLPLPAMDHGDRVILLKSFSKILMPGLRLGFLVLPKTLQDGFLAAKHSTDIASSAFLQRALYFYLLTGNWKEYLETVRQEYFCRYKTLKKLLDQHRPPLHYLNPKGGLFFWVRLPYGLDSNALAQEARRGGVAIAPGNHFLAGGGRTPWCRLSFAALDSQALQKAWPVLEKALETVLTQEADKEDSTFEPIL